MSLASSVGGAFGAPASQPPPPPPLSLGAGPPQQGPSVLQILAMGQERNHAADSIAHHPRMESLIKLGKESEQTWIQIGHTAETLGDLERAIASYESALRHNAYSVVALSQIAAICRSKEEFKKAAEYFGRVVGIAPESGDVWGALGHCYLMIDDLKKAYSSYQQALYYMPNPQEPKLWYGIGILYDRYGSLEHAEEAFSSVIRMDPQFEKANEIFFRLGIIYKQQRRSAQSLECFRYILQNPPRPLTEIDIWFQIGHVYEQQKDYLAAKDSYERVLAENPAHAKVLQQLGGLYHRSRAPFYNPELSVSILTKSLESDPNDPFSWYLLGRAYMTSNNFGKAYEAYQQAVYRDGKNPAFWCSIGVLYYNINQFHDALDAYSRAIRIHPYLAEVWFNLGALYESCNDQMTDAIDAYQRTLQLDPSNSIVSQRLREIREHQSSGAPLSTPPQPKDISPSSLSWNFATNAAGAAPTQIGQAGLVGAELSPAMSRSGGPPGPGSPINGARPMSTDPYRPGPSALDNRRASGGGPPAGMHHSPATSIDHSPRITNRHSISAQSHLPGMKSHHDPRASPVMTDNLHRRGSPVSPRTRGPPGADQRMSAYESEMEWRRRAPGSGPSGPTFVSPRPNGFEDGPQSGSRYASGPPPAQFAGGPYGGPPGSYGSGSADRRFERDQPGASEESRRRSSTSTAPRTDNTSPKQQQLAQHPSPQVAQLEQQRVPSPLPAKGKPGRPPVKKEDDLSKAGPARGRKSDASSSSAAAATATNGAAKPKKTTGGPKGRKGAQNAVTESSPAPASPVVPQAAANGGPSREVDEDYDEGVDALMGLAASAASNSPTIAAAVAPAPAQVEAAEDELDESANGSDNPRKRSLDSPEGAANKKPKQADDGDNVDELEEVSVGKEPTPAPPAAEEVKAKSVEPEVAPAVVEEVKAKSATPPAPEVVEPEVKEPEPVKEPSPVAATEVAAEVEAKKEKESEKMDVEEGELAA